MSYQMCFKCYVAAAVISILVTYAYMREWPRLELPFHNVSRQTAAAASPRMLENKAQDASGDKHEDLPKVIKEGGWKIPGLDQSKIKEARRHQGFYDHDGLQIYVTVLKPQRDIVTTFTPDELNYKSGVLPNRNWLVEKIIQYDINGSVFRYDVYVSMVSVSGPDNTTTRYGASTLIVYYDVDGDGKFEELDLGKSWGSPRIPQWLKGGSN